MTVKNQMLCHLIYIEVGGRDCNRKKLSYLPNWTKSKKENDYHKLDLIGNIHARLVSKLECSITLLGYLRLSNEDDKTRKRI